MRSTFFRDRLHLRNVHHETGNGSYHSQLPVVIATEAGRLENPFVHQLSLAE